jgi:glyoxylase I family protein
MPDTPPPLSGVHHVALSVSDVHGSAEWYARLLGFELLREAPQETFDRLVLRHPDTPLLLTLVAHRDVSHDTFDETRTGLDHLAFRARSAEDVDAWRRWLETQEVRCSEVKDGALPSSRLITFRDPDGIQVECYYSP